MEVFHKRLKRLRQQKKLTVKEMAQLIDVPESTYREWEYGRAIKGEPYLKIAHSLGVTVFELLAGKKPLKTNLFEKLDGIESLLRGFRSDLLPFFENGERAKK